MKYRNVKLKVLSPEHSAAFQEAVFESGGVWKGGGKGVKYTDRGCLYVSDEGENGAILSYGNTYSHLADDSHKQIHFITPAYKMTKIRIRNSDHSAFVQKKLFENGCSWMGGFTEAQHTDKPCLTVSETGEIRFCSRSFFDEQAHLKEIFIEDDAMPSASIISVGRPETAPSVGEAAFKLNPSTIYRSALFKGADGYEQLTHVLLSAHNQAAHGKGDERHANGQPFHEQRMQQVASLQRSAKGMEFQALKKITEGMQFDDAERREAELLGAINYIAGIVIYYRNGGK